MISALNLTVRAHALNTLSRQFGLLLGKEIYQSLAYIGIRVREDPLAVITGESPVRHAGLSPPVTDVGIHRPVYHLRDELVAWIRLLAAISWA
jgi:hypothetical protein